MKKKKFKEASVVTQQNDYGTNQHWLTRKKTLSAVRGATKRLQSCEKENTKLPHVQIIWSLTALKLKHRYNLRWPTRHDEDKR